MPAEDALACKYLPFVMPRASECLPFVIPSARRWREESAFLQRTQIN